MDRRGDLDSPRERLRRQLRSQRSESRAVTVEQGVAIVRVELLRRPAERQLHRVEAAHRRLGALHLQVVWQVDVHEAEQRLARHPLAVLGRGVDVEDARYAAHLALPLVGGIALNFGDQGSSYRVGRGPDFVIEGDEYDSAFFDKTAKFLKYLPDVAVINNIEFDHADIYADLDAVLLAFRRLVRLVPRNGMLLLGADSPHAAALREGAVSPVETFGLSALEAQARSLGVTDRIDFRDSAL